MRIIVFTITALFFLYFGQARAQLPEYSVWQTQMKTAFVSLDLDKNGYWTWNEYKESTSFALGPARNLSNDSFEASLSSAKEFFDIVDLNSDGLVSLDEYSSQLAYEAFQKELRNDIEDVTSYCEKTKNNNPSYGVQPDGNKALDEVMSLQSGHYANSDFNLKISDNDYFLIEYSDQNGVGGCSKEHLSEVLRNNNLSLQGIEKK